MCGIWAGSCSELCAHSWRHADLAKHLPAANAQLAECGLFLDRVLVDRVPGSAENVPATFIPRKSSRLFERRSSLTPLNRREFIAGSAALIGAAGVRLPVWAEAAAPAGVSPLLIGVDYYPDQTPAALWEEDARMMAETGFTNVRIAEFAWALMEPAEGKFDFGWLRHSVQILHKHNIAVILGTPSAAPPPWLSLKYPEIMEVDAHGQRLHCRRTALYLSYE